MHTFVGIAFVAIMFFVGSIHGALWRFYAFGKRRAIYVDNDEYRLGVFAASVVIMLFCVREMQSFVVYHAPLREGFWPLSWSLTYCCGIVTGFKRTKGIGEQSSPIQRIPEE